jgi:tetratricopeptide (TPR) repeat protein
MIEQSLLMQRTREMESTQRTNREMLAVAGVFAAVGFIAALVTAYFQWRAMSRFAEVSTALSANPGLGFQTHAALTNGEVLANRTVEQSNTRLITLIQHLEKRIAGLEQTTALPLQDGTVSSGAISSHPELPLESLAEDKTGRISMLWEKAQALLKDQPEQAVMAFDEILSLEPNHAEALVKKGTALEKLRQPQEALECYDRAIAADNSLTIAYLHKGGLCSRLEKYGEAMECYERALHTQEKKRAA